MRPPRVTWQEALVIGIAAVCLLTAGLVVYACYLRTEPRDKGGLTRSERHAADAAWNGRATLVAAYLRKRADGYKRTEGNTRRVLALEEAAEGVEKGRDYNP